MNRHPKIEVHLNTTEILVVGLSGFLGAVIRALFYSYFGNLNAGGFPWVTVLINSLGCLLMGTVGTWLDHHLSSSHHRMLFLAISVGFLGSFTTFSAFSWESFQLIRAHQWVWAGAQILAHLAFGLMAVFLGRFWVLRILA